MLAITCGSWIDFAMWSMNTTSTPTSISTNAIVTVIDRCGTNSPCAPGPIETSARIAYTNVATKLPSVSCVMRSRMKLRSMRGPNCVEASVSVTIVIEKTSVTTVITAAAIVVRICLAASGVPLITHEGKCSDPL